MPIATRRAETVWEGALAAGQGTLRSRVARSTVSR
jgi:hypothetical protein